MVVLTVLWDLAGAPLQQQAHSPPSGLDQLDGSGVGHVLGALAVDLDDLIPDLEVCDGDERRKRYTFRILLARNHPAVAGLVQLGTSPISVATTERRNQDGKSPNW